MKGLLGTSDPDWAVRVRAFAALEQLTASIGGRVPWGRLAQGFELEDGERVHFAGRALGIFKPKRMTSALSVRTSKPRPGRATWYEDQHAEMDAATGLMSYDLAQDPGHPSNEHLRLAFERNAPLVYLRAVAPAVYEVILPVWVEEFRISEGRALLAASEPARPETAAGSMHGIEAMERRPSYSIGMGKRRNHQAWFSSRTRAAYGYRCAFSGLPLGGLLVGAHIKADEDGGPSSVTNGICMSTLHHAAFDGYLIGVDPESRVHVARRVMDARDGPLLKSLQMLEGHTLRAPVDHMARPDPEFLAWRFEKFQQTRA